MPDARETAERLAVEKFSVTGLMSQDYARRGFISGFLAGRTVSAEQILSAAKASYEERSDSLWEAADAEDKIMERDDMVTGFRAAGFRIEGEE